MSNHKVLFYVDVDTRIPQSAFYLLDDEESIFPPSAIEYTQGSGRTGGSVKVYRDSPYIQKGDTVVIEYRLLTKFCKIKSFSFFDATPGSPDPDGTLTFPMAERKIAGEKFWFLNNRTKFPTTPLGRKLTWKLAISVEFAGHVFPIDPEITNEDLVLKNKARERLRAIASIVSAERKIAKMKGRLVKL